jgi:glycosyltransferase involved in cell wall biosynthesis
VIVGFGTYREGLQALVQALRRGDLGAAREVAARGRELEGGQPGQLSYLAGFLADPPEGYLAAARAAMDRLAFTGALEHGDLPPLLQASLAQVVPSTFPEAFGMVAAEAAACGALPVCALHSGLAEVVETLAPALPEDLRPLLGFQRGPGAVEEIAERLLAWLGLDPAERERASAALSEVAHREYGWEHVAERVLEVIESPPS